MRDGIDRKAGLLVSRLCEYGAVQDIDHYLIHCPILSHVRKIMVEKIQEVAIKLGITIDDITTKILIGTDKDFPHKLIVSICLAVCSFKAQTRDKVKI